MATDIAAFFGNTHGTAWAFRALSILTKESPLSRDDHVQLDGVVTNVFAGGQFEVKTDAGPIVRAQLSGRMRKNRIRVILGDRVTVALSPYDLTHGMITYRLK